MTNFNVKYSNLRRQLGQYLYRVGTMKLDENELPVRALEVVSHTKTGAEDSLYFPDLNVSLLFMIDQEEYSWMEQAPEKLDQLVLKLMEKLPKDRLMTGQYLGLAGGNKMAFQPKGKEETIDNFKIKFTFFEMPYAISEWKKVENVWVMTNNRVKLFLPAIDMNEAVNVFLNEDKAKAEVEKFGVDFRLTQMSGEKFVSLLEGFYKMGIPKIAVHNPGGTQLASISAILEKKEEVTNKTELNIVRFLQTLRSSHIQEENYRKTAQMWWNQLCQDVLQEVFIVPFMYEGEDMKEPVNDTEIHFFPSVNISNIKVNENKDWILVRNGKERLLTDTSEYSVSVGGSKKKMHMRTSFNPTLNQEWLGIFTNLEEFNRIWKGAAHVGIATFDDFKEHYEPAQGLVINPAHECFFIDKNTIEQLIKIQK